MKQIWYFLMRTYAATGLHFYFKEIRVVGRENIPEKGALLFVSNHKNALIDPLLIATTAPRTIYFLTRASAFKIPFVKWLLSTINMLPIYRIRDGKEAVAKNQEIFSQCYDIFDRKKSLLIFPEGTHDIRRWVRPLSKGFTRIIFGALEGNPHLKLTIIPVGLNYAKAEEYAASVSVYYGEPIDVKSFLNEGNKNEAGLKLRDKVSEKMKQLTTHVEDIENYDAVIKNLGYVDYLNPEKVNSKLKILDETAKITKEEEEPNFLWTILYYFVRINSFLPMLIWQLLKPKITEIEFVSTTKFAIGISAFPIFYFLQTMLIANLFNGGIALIYMIVSFASVWVLTKTKTE